MLIFYYFLCSFVILLFFLMVIEKFSENRWFCDFWGWHHPKPGDKMGFNGISMTGKCGRCGKDIMTDSNGDWFA